MYFFYLFFLFFLFLSLGCQTDQTVQSDHQTNVVYDELDVPHKPYPVGTTTLYMESQGRTIPVQLWYPSTQENMQVNIEEFEVGTHQDILRPLIKSLEHTCMRTQMHASLNGVSWNSPRPLPLILFSHCHGCLRFSSFTTAEVLAQQGYVVAAPDHIGDTLYDELNGDLESVSAELLQLRALDISAVLDQLLDQTLDLSVDLHLDESKVGVFGHSFGAVTTGLVLQNDTRFTAGVAIAAPIVNPLTPGVSIEKQTRPMLYMLAAEDNSITEIGNTLIRQNYEKHPAEAWKLEVKDAGHWSFSDICGLTDSIMSGCGMDTRQTNPSESVTYIENQRARDIAAKAVLYFFDYHFNHDMNAKKNLDHGLNDPFVESTYHMSLSSTYSDED